MDPALDVGPCPASVVLPGVTRTPPTGSAPTSDPHPVTSQPCSLHWGGPRPSLIPSSGAPSCGRAPECLLRGFQGSEACEVCPVEALVPFCMHVGACVHMCVMD